MKFFKLIIFLLLSGFLSYIFINSSKAKNYDAQLVEIQVQQEFPSVYKEILLQPFAIQLILLEYSSNQELTYKSLIALNKYPQIAKEVLLLYALEPDFKKALLKYGEVIFLPISYFINNEIQSVKIINELTNQINSVSDSVKKLWHNFTYNYVEKSDSKSQNNLSVIDGRSRGWYAINFINQEGYDFLGQFIVDKNQKVKWLQSERLLEGINSFFADGIRSLEGKYKLNEEISANDVFWAGVDIVIVGGSVKILRAGKVLSNSSKEVGLVARTQIFGARLLPKSEMLLKFGKYGAIAASVYVIIVHPQLINSAVANLAELLGFNPFYTQFLFWITVIVILLYPFFWLVKIIGQGLFFILAMFYSSKSR